MTLVLHDYALSAGAYKVRLFLALAGIAHETVGVDVFPGRENEGAAFLARAPMGDVPVLTDGDVVVETAEATLIHLAETRAPDWLPGDQPDRARTLAWLVFAARDLAAADGARMAAILGTPAGDQAARATRAFATLEDHLVLRGLAGERFLAAPAPTVADIAAFPPAALAVEYGEDLSRFPKLRAWSRRIRALPGFIGMPGVPEFV
ncbi:MAG: glutathione S-transferase family protein [Pseudomonadota bacterium]